MLSVATTKKEKRTRYIMDEDEIQSKIVSTYVIMSVKIKTRPNSLWR